MKDVLNDEDTLARLDLRIGEARYLYIAMTELEQVDKHYQH